MIAICIGKIHMSRADVLESTLKELIAILYAHYEQEHNREKVAHNIARWQIFHSWKQGDVKDKLQSVYDIHVFDWEKDVKERLAAEQRAANEKAKELLNRWEKLDADGKWKKKTLSIADLKRLSN